LEGKRRGKRVRKGLGERIGTGKKGVFYKVNKRRSGL